MATFRADQDAMCDLLDADSVTDWGNESWGQLSQAVSALESAWKQTPFPELAQFIPIEFDPQREAILVELIKVDQEYRWRAGQPRPLEEYLHQWAELKSVPKRVAGLLAAECLTRASFDVAPTADELRSRFPDVASLISLEAIESQVRAERRPSPRRTATSSAPQSVQFGMPIDRSAKSISVGGQIGRFEIRGIVGRGGMGIVFRAYDPQLHREVALKAPLLGQSADQAVVKRFLREARIVADIQHPHICPVFECGEIDGVPYLVMPLVKGDALGDWLKRCSPTPDQCVDLLIKLAKALDRLHAAGILHQDIKPNNVVVNENDEPLLMDFGLAWKSEAEMKSVTPDGFVGTPAYMSPEQVRGNVKAIDQRSDIYSLGVLMFEMLTGRPPFVGAMFEVLKNILQTEPPSPRSLKPELDVALEAICLKVMAKRPDDRYQSAKDFATALENQQLPETLIAARSGRLLKPVAIRKAAIAVAVLLPLGFLWSWYANRPKGVAISQSVPNLSSAPTVGAPAAIGAANKHSAATGESVATATVLDLGNSGRVCVEGEITKRRERLWYRVQPDRTGPLVVEALTIRDNLNTHVTIHDADLKEIAADGNAGPGLDAQLVLQVESKSTYYIAVFDQKQATGPFLLVVSQPDAPPPFAPELGADTRLPVDSNPNGPDGAKDFEFDAEGHAIVVGSIQPEGDEDWYRFISKGGGLLLIKVETPHSSLDAHFELYHDQTLISEDNDRIVAHGLAAGAPYLVRIRANSPLKDNHVDPTGNYVLRFRYLDEELAHSVLNRN